MTVSPQLLLLWWGVVFCDYQRASTYCTMPVLFKSEVVMKLIICNLGKSSEVMPLIKSCRAPGVLEPDQHLHRSHGDRRCLQQHIFPGKLSLASRHLPQQRRQTHLFGFPAETQCGIFSFQRGALWLFSRDYEVATTTDRRWRPHETKHRSGCTWRGTARGRPPWFKKKKNAQEHLQPQRQTNIPLTQMCACAKKPHRHIPITAPSSSETFIINRGNHRRLLIGDALVGVSEVSGVLSLSICKLPQLGEKRRDVALSCAPPGDCEGCNLKPSFSSHHSLWLAALTPRLEHTNSGTAVWESPPLVAGIESKRHNMQMKERHHLGCQSPKWNKKFCTAANNTSPEVGRGWRNADEEKQKRKVWRW